MGKSVNKVILLGRAGKDPEVHILRSGTLVNLSLATAMVTRIAEASGKSALNGTTWLAFNESAKSFATMSGRAHKSSWRANYAPVPGRIGSQDRGSFAPKSSFMSQPPVACAGR